MNSLFEIESKFQIINDRLDEIAEEMGGLESIPEDLEVEAIAILNQKDLTEQARLEKIDNWVALIKERKYRAEVRLKEVERMKKLAESDRAAQKWLSEQLLKILEANGESKITTNRFNLSIARNGGKRAVELRVNPEELPEAYRRAVWHEDKDAIREALESENSDIQQFAYLKSRGTHLRIS